MVIEMVIEMVIDMVIEKPMIFRLKKIDFPFHILVNSVSFRFSAVFTDC